MKRKISLFLTFALIASIVCGCNGVYVFTPDGKSQRHESSSSSSSSKSKSDSNDSGVIIIDDDEENNITNATDDNQFSEPYYPYPTDPTGDSNPEGFYSHNIYCDPDILYDKGIEAFSIDFLIPEESDDTYWCMSNFRMDYSTLGSEIKIPEKSKNRAGGYGGIQNTSEGKVFIGSIWDLEYYDNNSINRKKATLIDHVPGTPIDGTRFENEGEGARCKINYNWSANKWYRFVIRSYGVEIDNGVTTTIVDQWLQDKDTQEWFLIARYDTGFPDSSMKGNFSQFLECFSGDTYYLMRSVYWKNIYVMYEDSNTWSPIEGATLKVAGELDENKKPNKKGGFSFGSNSEYFWAITCGVGDNILLTEPDVKREGHYYIKNSDEAPNLDELSKYQTEKVPEYTIEIRWDETQLVYPTDIELNFNMDPYYSREEMGEPYDKESVFYYFSNEGSCDAIIKQPNIYKNETFNYMTIDIYNTNNINYNVTWDTGINNSNCLADCQVTIYRGNKKLYHLTDADLATRAATGVWYMNICSINNGFLTVFP